MCWGDVIRSFCSPCNVSACCARLRTQIGIVVERDVPRSGDSPRNDVCAVCQFVLGRGNGKELPQHWCEADGFAKLLPCSSGRRKSTGIAAVGCTNCRG